MRVYQLVVDWSIKLRSLLDRKLQLNSLQEAQLARQDYANAVSSLTDVSQNLSEMNHEFDKINEVCSTGYLKNKLHEAETLKIDIETVLFERNLFLHETTEEWQQFEHKIKSVREWIQGSYHTLNSPELKNKPLRDQLRILDQMLADISAQKIKVNMSLEKLQVHFHSEVVYSDNPNIVHSGRTVIEDLDKLNRDVFQTTQNLDQALVQIDECQSEMQAIRQRIVQEEQQLRNILSPLHQSCDSDKNEQELPITWTHGIDETAQQDGIYDPMVHQNLTLQKELGSSGQLLLSTHTIPMENNRVNVASYESSTTMPNVTSVWNNSERTYAEVVAGLQRQRRAEMEQNAIENRFRTNLPVGQKSDASFSDKTEASIKHEPMEIPNEPDNQSVLPREPMRDKKDKSSMNIRRKNKPKSTTGRSSSSRQSQNIETSENLIMTEKLNTERPENRSIAELTKAVVETRHCTPEQQADLGPNIWKESGGKTYAEVLKDIASGKQSASYILAQFHSSKDDRQTAIPKTAPSSLFIATAERDEQSDRKCRTDNQ